MSRAYASQTSVPIAQSKAEIERLVTRYGATAFASGWKPEGTIIMFEAKGRRIRFELPGPDRKKFSRQERYDQEDRRRWRCLVLAIKSKLEAVESGIATFEDEFLAHIVVPGRNETFGQWAGPQIAAAYQRGTAMPPLLGTGP